MAVSKRLRSEIFRRDSSTCYYCGAKAPNVEITIDHVIPVTLGGSDDPSNLVTACAPCNSGKTSVPPDAATVKQVSADAVRWARAIEAAAENMVGQHEGARAAFDQKWRAWGEGRPPVPRPEDWGLSIDRFLKVGLPLPLLLDCVDVAMRARHVKADEVFKYMCGVAWKEVAKLQETARAMLEEGNASPSRAVAPAGPAPLKRLDAVRGLLELLTDREMEMVDLPDRNLAVLDEDGVDPIVSIMDYVLCDLRGELDALQVQVVNLLEVLPDGLGWHAMKMARFDLYDVSEDDFPNSDFGKAIFTNYAAHSAMTLAKVRAGLAHLEGLPVEERREWETFTQNRHRAYSNPEWYRPLDPSQLVIHASRNAQELWDHKKGWARMCSASAEHIPTCPQVATHAGLFENVNCCVDKDIADHWHPLCEQHVALLVDGLYTNRRGVLVSVRDFKELPERD